MFVDEEDIAMCTIKELDDPRTLNKALYLRLPENTLSVNELVALWENKIGKPLCIRRSAPQINSRSVVLKHWSMINF